tara:strand:- start:1853 stop:2881 length:1029 start_codon:yes stop_codon:yes gene_type:complete
MINQLKKLKKTFFWDIFITNIFYHVYHFFWTYILNLKSKILGIFWNFNKNDFFNLDKNDKLLISENEEFKSLAYKIAIDSKKIIPELKKEIFSEEYKKKLNKNNQAYAETPYSIDFYSKLNDELKKEIVSFASSERMITTATKYMGVLPMITRIQVSLNIPRKNSNLRSAMLWHKDVFGFKSLDFFMAVTDITDENGPFYCLEDKIKAGVFKSFPYSSSKTGERGKVSLEEFQEKFKDKKCIKLIGNSGNAIFIDSFSSYHRGGHCKSEDRIIFRICYQTQDVIPKSYKREKEFFIFDKSIKRSETKDIFKRYIFFNRPSFLMRYLSIIILKFFSIIEFKYK